MFWCTLSSSSFALYSSVHCPVRRSLCILVYLRVARSQLVLSSTDSVRRRRGRVLVHCLAGISRSATICIAYLMYHKRLPLEAAYDFVKCRRQLIAPNLNFMRQLVEFEQHVLATGGGGGGSGEGGSPPGSPEDGERVATPRFTLPLTPSCTLQAAAPSVFQFDVSPPATTATTYASNPLLSPG